MDEARRPVLDQVNLVVRDMEAMLNFYRRLGVEIRDAPSPWDRHHNSATSDEGADLDLDSRAFAAVWNEGWDDTRHGAVIGFRLASRAAVDATFADLVGAGFAAQQEPYDAFWGARYAVVEDPDGNSVGLMSPVDPSRRTAPPAPPA